MRTVKVTSPPGSGSEVGSAVFVTVISGTVTLLPGDPLHVERFEFFIGGMEMGNAREMREGCGRAASAPSGPHSSTGTRSLPFARVLEDVVDEEQRTGSQVPGEGGVVVLGHILGVVAVEEEQLDRAGPPGRDLLGGADEQPPGPPPVPVIPSSWK